MSINSSFTLYPRAGSAFSAYQVEEVITQREKPSLLVQALISGEISGDDGRDRLIRGTVLPNLRAKRILDAKKDTSSPPKAYAPFEPLVNQRNMSSGTISCLSEEEFKAWKGAPQLADSPSEQATDRTVDWDKSLSHTQRLQQEVRKSIESQIKDSRIYKAPRAIRVNPFELNVTDRKLKNGTISPFLHDEYRAWNKSSIVPFQNQSFCDATLGSNDVNWKWQCYKAEIGRCDARKEMLHIMEENRCLKIQMIQCKVATLESHPRNVQAERDNSTTDSPPKQENWIDNFDCSGLHNEIGTNKQVNTSFVNKRRGDCAQDSPLYDFSVNERSMLHDREVEVERTSSDSTNQADKFKLSSNGDINVSALTSMSFGSVNKDEDVQNAPAEVNDSGSPNVSEHLQQQQESTDEWTGNQGISKDNMDDIDSKTKTPIAKLPANVEQRAITCSSEVGDDDAMTSPLLVDQENPFMKLSASTIKPLQEATTDLSSIGSVDADKESNRDDIIHHGTASRNQDKGEAGRGEVQSKTSISPPRTRSSVKERKSEFENEMAPDSKIITSSRRTDPTMSRKVEEKEGGKENHSGIVSKKHRKDEPKSEDHNKMAPSFSSNADQDSKKKRRRRGTAIAHLQAPVVKKTRSRTRR